MKETKFKSSLLHPIPEDWVDGVFGDFLTTFSSGATPYRGVPSNFVGKIPWISSGELNYNCIVDTNEHISKDAQRKTHLTLHQTGTFLMAITGLEAAGTRGRCAFVGTPATTNQSCLAINSTDKMTVEYLFWFYRYWSDYLAFNYSQGSKQQSFTAKIAKKLPIYAPKELQEQKAIAEALTDIDELIKGLDEWIAKKKAILEGTMQELLSGKRRLPGFSEPWEIKNILADCTIKTGKIDANHAVDYGQFPFFTCDAIPKRIDEYAFDQEAVLISGNGSRLGHISYYNGKFNAYQRTYVIGPFDDEIITTYRVQILKFAFRDYIQTVCKASSIPFITLPVLNEYVYSVPSDKDEQKAIATVLSDMDAEIAELEAKREKYVAIRQGMMQQLLTGKIRLI